MSEKILKMVFLTLYSIFVALLWSVVIPYFVKKGNNTDDNSDKSLYAGVVMMLSGMSLVWFSAAINGLL